MQKVLFSLMLVISLLFGVGVNAVEEYQYYNNGEKARAFLEALSATLELTEAQEEAIKPIIQDSLSRRQAILEEVDITAWKDEQIEQEGKLIEELTSEQKKELRAKLRSLRKQLKAVNKDTRAALKDVLTKKQFSKYKEISAKKKKMMKAKIKAKIKAIMKQGKDKQEHYY